MNRNIWECDIIKVVYLKFYINDQGAQQIADIIDGEFEWLIVSDIKVRIKN